MRTYRVFLPLAAMAAIVLPLLACATATPAASATDIAAMVVLEDSYRGAKQTLHDRLDDFPVETGLALLELEKETDTLVEDYRQAWSATISPGELQALIERTSLLYDEGKALVTPHMDQMTLAERQRLKRLDTAWTRVDAAFDRWQSDPAAVDRAEMARAGMELATALLLVL